MNKFIKRTLVCLLIMLVILPQTFAIAESGTYEAAGGDTMWKIAVKHQPGLSEVVKANSQIFSPEIASPESPDNEQTIDDIKVMENELIRLVNAERAIYGLAPLYANVELGRVARCKSQDMLSNGYFAHQSPTYGSPYVMIESFGIEFSSAGENLAFGQATPAAVMSAWMNSPGHGDIILNATYDQIGAGVAKAENGNYYWTLMFIKSIC